MIVSMSKIRILGTADLLEDVLDELQDLEAVHLVDADEDREPLRPAETPRHAREAKSLRRALEDVEWVLERAGETGRARERTPPPEAGREATARWARLGRRTRRRLEALEERLGRLETEKAALDRYLAFLDAFASLGKQREEEMRRARAFHLVLTGGDADLERLDDGLRATLEGDYEVMSAPLEGGERAVLLLASPEAARQVDDLLDRIGLEELSLPADYGPSLAEARPSLEARRSEVRDELSDLRAERRELLAERTEELRPARAAMRDRLLELEALGRAGRTERAFVLEGWVPEAAAGRVERRLVSRFGEPLVVEVVDREEWEGEEAPVELSNPRLFRPFEAITSLLPLPRYGSIDPTPFVAVFFPMFFGVILGDVGYGLVLGLLSGWLHRRSKPGSTLRAVSEIGGAAAVFTVAFGLVYGELFGTLGHDWLGLEPLGFDRQEAMVAFLVFALALGLVHVVLGLVLGAVATFRSEPKTSLGRGLSALMVLLVVVAILAATRVLPGGFFTPAVVALLVAFPVLVALEGFLAPIELLSTLGNVLSYARIMALGTASVVMAAVANRLAGTVGSVAVGVLFGLIFHLINFALGVFGPVIHGIRLHYVEFFGKFYSPGGVAYRPFGHWRPGGDGAT